MHDDQDPADGGGIVVSDAEWGVFSGAVRKRIEAAVGFNLFFGYRIPELGGVASGVASSLLAELPASVQEQLAGNGVLPPNRLTLCVVLTAAYSPDEEAAAARCGAAAAAAAPPPCALAFGGAAGYGAHKLVLPAAATTSSAVAELAAALRQGLAAAGLPVGPSPRPHVSVMKIGYAQGSKKEKSAANKLAKAAGFARLASEPRAVWGWYLVTV